MQKFAKILLLFPFRVTNAKCEDIKYAYTHTTRDELDWATEREGEREKERGTSTRFGNWGMTSTCLNDFGWMA